MVKLIISVDDGRLYHVLIGHTRVSDPSREESRLGRPRIYRSEVFDAFKARRAIVEMIVDGLRVAFVEQSVPQLIGGKSTSFWMLYARRNNYKHASSLGLYRICILC